VITDYNMLVRDVLYNSALIYCTDLSHFHNIFYLNIVYSNIPGVMEIIVHILKNEFYKG
jgi:hypothetical protein